MEPQPAPAPEPTPAEPKVWGTCAWEGCEAPLYRWNRKYCDSHRRAAKLAGMRDWHARRKAERATAGT